MLIRSNFLLLYSIAITAGIIIYFGSQVNVDDYKNYARLPAFVKLEENQDKLQTRLSQEEIVPNANDPMSVFDEITEITSNVNDANSDDDIVADNKKHFMESDAVTDDDIGTDIEERLRSILNCFDRSYNSEILQRGDFWVLKNYVLAEHGQLKCHNSITYTTHSDFTFLDNVIPLLERWNAPLSIAIHAPGTDFQYSLETIKYLRDCLPQSSLVRMFATFHIYFSSKHFPDYIPKYYDALTPSYNCTLPPPYANVSAKNLYKSQKKLLYPVNVGRNIARDAALTHFILPSDIELYPSRGLAKQFLEMIARNETYLHSEAPRVFVLSIFEVKKKNTVPHSKTELQEYLQNKKAIAFHKNLCGYCHGIPGAKQWKIAKETDKLNVSRIAKRYGSYKYWEPIYIGTHADPYYDEQTCWEGGRDKMSQAFALCLLGYEFHILDNAFIVHKPGIKGNVVQNYQRYYQSLKNQGRTKQMYKKLRATYGGHYNVPVPQSKTELQKYLRINKAIPFHKHMCPHCHNMPEAQKWMEANETNELNVFFIADRVGEYKHWEPIYIGTHADPHYDERLSWEGKRDKMTQGYAFCALSYEFHILNNAFLVHKPGIKILSNRHGRKILALYTNQYINKILYRELRILYGTREGCVA